MIGIILLIKSFYINFKFVISNSNIKPKKPIAKTT